MFNKNAYIFPQGSPSSHPRNSASLVGLTGNEFLLHHHHHHDMLSGHHLAAAAALSNQELYGLNDGEASAMVNPSCTSTKASSKKDRHSKINTAQGPRDRRVRLSIGVARKFFDLQEILGFDKPSKTLDWLLTKSETAITDLEQMREKASTQAAKSASSECEVNSADTIQNGTDLKQTTKLKGAAAKDSTQKESRVKARARARERTREKMCIKKLNEIRNINGSCDLTPIQFMNNQLEFRKISGGSSSSSTNINLGFREAAMLHCHPSFEAAPSEDLIQESIVIKRKVKHPSSIMGFQQNLIISSSSNYGAVPTPYNAAAENWDNICALLDQHKFINSTSNN